MADVDLSQFVDQPTAAPAATGVVKPSVTQAGPVGPDLSQFVDNPPVAQSTPANPVTLASVLLNPMPSLTNKPLADAVDYSYYGPSRGNNIDPKAYQQDLEDQRAMNPGLDDTSMAPEVNAWLNTVPAANRKDVAEAELAKTGTTAAEGLLGLALSGGIPEIAGLGKTGIGTAADIVSDLGSGVKSAWNAIPIKSILKGLGVPGLEEGLGWGAKKVLHGAGIEAADPWIDKAVLLAQLASPGAVAKAAGGVHALSEINDAIKGRENASSDLESVPAGHMEQVEPDPTMVTSPYTSGMGYGPSTGFQGQQYSQPNGAGIYIPH